MKSHGAFYMLNFRKVRSYEAHFAAIANSQHKRTSGGYPPEWGRPLNLCDAIRGVQSSQPVAVPVKPDCYTVSSWEMTARRGPVPKNQYLQHDC